MKISVDEVFMHYFQIVSALGLRWGFRPQTQNLPTPWTPMSTVNACQRTVELSQFDSNS